MAIRINSGDLLNSSAWNNHIKIYAGPGAGKTHFLVENIKNIIKTNPVISNSTIRKILCITYTNNAVDEVKNRLDSYSDAVEVYTIHSFILQHIIMPFQHDLKQIIKSDFNIEIRKSAKITSQIEGLGILHGINKDAIYDYVNNELSTNETLSFSKKNMGAIQVDNTKYLKDNETKLISPTTTRNRVPVPVFQSKYLMPIKKYTWTVVNKLTHDEILYFGYRILQENSTILYALRVRFPFIFVDEFQDTNPLQTEIIKLIGLKSTITCIIGDVAQSIYSFQGARPSQFLNYNLEGARRLVEYQIKGNRRSPNNIVNLCNYLRKADTIISQNSIKEYKNAEEKALIESYKIQMLVGESQNVMNIIDSVIQDEGVVLTRTWAAAFSYIHDIEDEQLRALRAIYSSYYNSPIDIRSEIAEHNNIIWVRSFKFIIMLWEAYKTDSFVDVLLAIRLYKKIIPSILTPSAIFNIKTFLDDLFVELSDDKLTTQIIDKFNELIAIEKYKDFNSILSTEEPFTLTYFSDLDQDRLKDNLYKLTWETSCKLFKEVFSKKSKYMTVHQAKGLEWDKVVVCLAPSRTYDDTTLEDMFTSPQILHETPSEEFTRMYYVACSRAKEKLYIHLPDEEAFTILKTKIDEFANNMQIGIEYEILR